MRRPGFEDLLAVVRALIGPDGCPWDRAQTPRSLLPYLIEEAYEVREAVLSGDDAELAGELGDLALHVAFQALLAERRGAFVADDVFRRIVDKMVRRHAHVFERGSDQPIEAPTLPEWEAAKLRERAGRPGRTLDGLPAALPALHKAQRLQDRAAGVGFDWPDADGPLTKVREELEEVVQHLGARAPLPAASSDPRPAAAGGALEDELGDLLFAVVNLARKLDVSAEEALDRSAAKFRRRFERVEDLAAARGIEVRVAELEVLDALWDEAKRAE
jgi:MazG family protein